VSEAGANLVIDEPRMGPSGLLAATEPAVNGYLASLPKDPAVATLPAKRRDDLVIVLGEALNNIVEHAYEDRGPGAIGITIWIRGPRIEVEITDAGRPLPPRLVRGATLPDISACWEDLPEGGFGWFIIHELTSDMMYERKGRSNVLNFSLESGLPAPS
jgi:serine/threonine-protein kinase RsbW